MKRKISVLLAALLLCGMLGGCGASGGTAQTDAGMQLTPAQLSEDETELLGLAGVQPSEFVLYDYQTDENLRCITIQRYILSDALAWEPADSGFYQTYSDTPLAPDGRFALTGKADSGYTLQFSADGLGDVSHAPDLPESVATAPTAIGVGAQLEAVPIVYGEEIPLFVRTFRDKSELYVYDAARDFIDPSRFEGDLFTEAYTVTFSDTVPE